MIALSRARGFSAGNWQILLTNNNLNAPLIGIYIALMSLGRSRQQILFRKADFRRNRIRQWAGGSRRHKCYE
jgi:hypothetical protein